MNTFNERHADPPFYASSFSVESNKKTEVKTNNYASNIHPQSYRFY